MHKLIDNLILIINQASLSSVATSCTVSGDLTQVNALKPVYAYVEQEKIEITNVSGQDITLVRGVGGTTQVSHINGIEIKLNIVAENINELIDNKVDTSVGKDLSENDFTNALKNKLDAISNNANNYTHPTSHPIALISGLQASLNDKASTGLMAAKGDIFVYNGTVLQKLPVGTNGQVLTADSALSGGIGWKDIPPPVFGADYFYDKFTTYSQMVGNSFATYRSVNTPVIPIGTYRIAMYVVGNSRSTGASFRTRMNVDNVPLGEALYVESKDANVNQRKWFYSIDNVTFSTAVSHTLKVEVASSSTTVSSDTRLSIIEIWRVS